MNTTRILVYHGLEADRYWLADTKAKLNGALRGLFKYPDSMGYYEHDSCKKTLERARNNNKTAIRNLLAAHRHDGNQEWELVDAEIITAHVSPNNAEEGSFVFAAEEWILEREFSIPERAAYPHLYQAMLDEAMEHHVDGGVLENE
jgi:hypothetical protein